MAPLLTPAWGICSFTHVIGRPLQTQRVCLGPAPRSSALELGLHVHFLGWSRDTYAPDVISNEDTRPRSPAPSQLPTCRGAGERFRVLPVQVAGLTGRCGSAGRAPCLAAAESPRGPRRLTLSHRAAGTCPSPPPSARGLSQRTPGVTDEEWAG